MKKLNCVSALVCAAVLAVLAGCASAPQQQGASPQTASAQPQAAPAAAPQSLPVERNIRGNVPQFVKDAVKKAPKDAYVGIGTAKMSSTSQSRTFAATRARAEISRQVLSLMQDAVRDFTAGSEIDPSAAIAYQETFTLALSKSALQGSSVVDEDMDDQGAYWVIVMMSKDGAATEINQAAAEAKLKVPKMASLDAEKRMNDAFDKLAGQEIQVQDK